MDKILASAPTRSEILAELKQFVLPDLDEDEFTLNDAKEQYNMPHNRAKSWAARMLADGKITVDKKYDPRSSKVVNAYRLVPPKPGDDLKY